MDIRYHHGSVAAVVSAVALVVLVVVAVVAILVLEDDDVLVVEGVAGLTQQSLIGLQLTPA